MSRSEGVSRIDTKPGLAILGAGAWGTALAIAARRAGREIVLWARDPKVVEAVNDRHENPALLPGISLDPAIHATTDLAQAVAGAAGVLAVVPAQFLRGVLAQLGTHLAPGIPLLLCAKGVECGSLALMTEVAAELLPRTPLAVLSGPTFAAEVARDLPAAVTIASHSRDVAECFQQALGSARFRPYVSLDPVGAEIGGAVKNVLAIACGIIEGRGLGDNARAALITRGLAEMMRLGIAKGGKAETLSGLSGMGDLVLTCSAAQSRNYALGLALGRGESLDAALAGRRAVVEGVASAASVAELARRLGVDMPITVAVDAVLHAGVCIEAMTEALLSRPYRSE